MSVTTGSFPREVAGYKVHRVIGRGGMGVVLLAVDPQLERPVALKLLPAHYSSDRDFRSRFIRESQTAASLDDPNIIPIYAAGEDEGQLYIAMRYVSDGDIGRLFNGSTGTSPERTALIVKQVASALDAAHRSSLIHRDIKPENILLSSSRGGANDHCYLADFGLSKRLDGTTNLTRTGQLLGSALYMAPEIALGEKPDRRCDIYSLAVLMFRLLAGQPLFSRDTEMATINAHINDVPRRLSAVRSDYSSRVDRVLLKALDKSPENRHGSAGEFAQDLSDALTGERSPRSGRSRSMVSAATGAPAGPWRLDRTTTLLWFLTSILTVFTLGELAGQWLNRATAFGITTVLCAVVAAGLMLYRRGRETDPSE